MPLRLPRGTSFNLDFLVQHFQFSVKYTCYLSFTVVSEAFTDKNFAFCDSLRVFRFDSKASTSLCTRPNHLKTNWLALSKLAIDLLKRILS